MTDPLRVEIDGAVARVVLQRPERLNALTIESLEALREAAESIPAGTRVVIIGGDGGTFSAGVDLSVLAELHGGAAVDPGNADLGRQMIDAIESIPAVTIAQIEGHCVGGGLVLATACDLRIAAEGTYFAIPEVDLGIPLTWGAIPRLVRAIGPARTMELVATCRPFTAAEAEEMGLVNRVMPESELAATVDELAAKLAAKPGYALRTVTRMVRESAEALAPALGRVGDAEALIAATKDEESTAAARAYLDRLGEG